MALLDVSDLLSDPDFTDKVTLIQRSAEVNEYGETVLVEKTCCITAVVQGNNTETLTKGVNQATLSDMLTIYTKRPLTAERAGGYSDIIIWQGKRYQVKEVPEDFTNFGGGFTRATCALEPVSA